MHPVVGALRWQEFRPAYVLGVAAWLLKASPSFLSLVALSLMYPSVTVAQATSLLQLHEAKIVTLVFLLQWPVYSVRFVFPKKASIMVWGIATILLMNTFWGTTIEVLWGLTLTLYMSSTFMHAERSMSIYSTLRQIAQISLVNGCRHQEFWKCIHWNHFRWTQMTSSSSFRLSPTEPAEACFTCNTPLCQYGEPFWSNRKQKNKLTN